MKCSRKGCTDARNTHFILNIFFFRKSYNLWDNMEKYCTAGQARYDDIIRRMRIECWILKATKTHSDYVILTAFPQQQGLRERISVLTPFVRCQSCIKLNTSTYHCACAVSERILKPFWWNRKPAPFPSLVTDRKIQAYGARLCEATLHSCDAVCGFNP